MVILIAKLISYSNNFQTLSEATIRAWSLAQFLIKHCLLTLISSLRVERKTTDELYHNSNTPLNFCTGLARVFMIDCKDPHSKYDRRI